MQVTSRVGTVDRTPSDEAWIDLNCDLGESFGRWTLGDDARVVRHVTSANVACGFHAGDFTVMDRTVALCKAAGVAVGAQPGYPDLQGFGRRGLALSEDDVTRMVLYQVGALFGFCRAHGVDLQHVKPHGALYNLAAIHLPTARAIARAVRLFSASLPLMGLAGSAAFAEAAAEEGVTLLPEAFADRRYTPEGTLQDRREAGSLLVEPGEAAAQARGIAIERTVVAFDGQRLAVRAATICIHGDTPGAVEVASAVRTALEEAGVRVRATGRHEGAGRGAADRD